MKILLVRHGESQANIDQKLHRTVPDHEIALSTRGQNQAKEIGKKLNDIVLLEGKNWRLWNSPYRRTRDTANIIAREISESIPRSENMLLCEQQFGLFDGLEDDEIKEKFPEEYRTWKLCKQYNGKFWARYPMGESPFGTAVRIKQSFRDFDSSSDHIIVCHGTVVKLFAMMWFNHTPEWFETEPTIGNCGIYSIEDYKDNGWLIPGYKKGKLVERK